MNTTKQTTDFEHYLDLVCFNENPAILDDDMSDFFDRWVSELGAEDFIRYANEYKALFNGGGMTEHLHEILKNPNDKLLAIDMDGTICEGEFWGEGKPTPKQDFIDKMWVWYKQGAHIVIYTARQPVYYASTHAWLIEHQVPFHGIAMLLKPGADLYIDDKTLNTFDV